MDKTAVDVMEEVCNKNTNTDESGWCAKLYEHRDYKGWEEIVREEVMPVNLNKAHNDQLSAAKVNNGCTLKLYKHYNHHIHDQILLDILTSNLSFTSGYDDEVSSVSCTCT